MSKAIALVVLALALTPSCALFQGACAETAAARASAAALISDAQIALDQAADVIAMIASPGVRHNAFVALDAAQASLRSAASALAGTKDVCVSFDVGSAFAAFRDAWQSLVPYLALFGGPSESAVRPPLVVSR